MMGFLKGCPHIRQATGINCRDRNEARRGSTHRERETESEPRVPVIRSPPPLRCGSPPPPPLRQRQQSSGHLSCSVCEHTFLSAQLGRLLGLVPVPLAVD